MLTGEEGRLGARARTGILLGALVVSLVAIVAAVRAPIPGVREEPRSEPVSGRPGRYRAVERLDLSRAQREAWSGAWHAQVDGLLPALDEVSELRAKLREELASEAPDAATVGAYVIEIRGLADTIGAARGRLDAALSEILDDEQKARYEELTGSRSSS